MSDKSIIFKRHMKRGMETLIHDGPKAFFVKVKNKLSKKNTLPSAAPIADSAFKDAYSLDKEGMLGLLRQYDVISFDVFDTLFVRKCSVEEIFEKIPKVAGLGEKFEGNHFKELRIEAEIEALSEKKRFCNLDDIYECLQKITKASENEILLLKDAEIKIEEDALIPRRDMCDIFKTLVFEGHTVIIVSDMYLQKPFFERIFEKNNITGFSKLYVSCDEGLRKDDGTLFKKVKEDFSGKSIIHVGDNHVADFEKPREMGLEAR